MGKESKGFIKIDRNIFEHWIFQDAEKFRAFVDIIQLARWKDEKLLIGNNVLTVPRGSYYTSELKLAERWSWSRKKTREFLKLLENEKMIIKKGTSKGTMLTIENYRVYQDEGATISTTKEHQRNNGGTSKVHQKNNEGYTKEEIKEIKEIKEGKEGEEIGPVLQSLSTPTNTHKAFLDRFGETSYRTWLMNREVIEDDKTVKIFVESEFYKNALEKYISSLGILVNKKIEVEVRNE